MSQFKLPNAILAASSGFDQPSMIALASSRRLDVAAPIVEGLPTKQRDRLICYKASTYGSNGRHSGIVDHFHWQSRLAMTHRTEENNSA